MANWRLFRYRNRDGSSKDWAVTTNSDGSISTRWGKTAARLPSINTRQGIRQFDIERQKQAKGYSFVAEVTIDSDGKISLPGQNLNQPMEADTNPLAELEQSRSLVGTLYWHINCKADPDTWVNFAVEVQRLNGVIQTLKNHEAVSENVVDGLGQAEPVWDSWQQLLDLTLTRQAFTQSGQILQAQGVLPWLLLMALKFKGFVGVDIGVATEYSWELTADIKAEPEVLAFFGTDLDSVRPVAELLGLLNPRLNLASALSDTDDCWF
jgi:hypothetical protein